MLDRATLLAVLALRRYRVCPYEEPQFSMEESADGGYIEVDDIEALLK